MLFSSIIFIYHFLPVVMIIYWIVPYRFKNYVCLVASLIFYAWGEPIYIFLMIGSILVNYVFGMLLHIARDKSICKIIVLVSVIFNIGLLGVFKYSHFFVSNLSTFLGIDIAIPPIALPLGISFYTFQAMSYIIDVYRGNALPQKNVFKIGLYISAFPQLVAGPIVRYNTIMEQIDKRTINTNKIAMGIVRFSVGLGKKILIANTLGKIADSMFIHTLTPSSTAAAWLGIIAYTLQIYFDFSGYSDMAIGLGLMLGFEFEENFRYPYLSKSVSEFWRRWHISMGTWFRDYLYIPLGGSRGSGGVQIRNLLIVWLATGLWHGAGWTFILWGLYYFILLTLERLYSQRIKSMPNVFRHLVTLVLIMVGWVLFRADTLIDAWNYFLCLLGIKTGTNFISARLILYDNWLIFLLGIVAATPIATKLVNHSLKISLMRDELWSVWILRMVFVCAILGICTVYLVNSTYNPFIYFRF